MKFKLVYIPQTFILLFFLVTMIIGMYHYYDYTSVTGNVLKWPVDPYFGNMFLSSYVLPSLILIFPLLGVFFKRMLGWCLVGSYFYFVLVGAIANAHFDIKFEQPFSLLLVVVVVVVVVVFISMIAVLIFIMNKPSVFKKYRIKKENLLKLNLVCFIVGTVLSLIIVIKNNQHFYETI